jgi:hypothetical protein
LITEPCIVSVQIYTLRMHVRPVRNEAVRLRKQGFSYPYISAKTGISKSTLSGWLAEVPYTPNRETIQNFGKARAAATEKKAKERNRQMEEIRQIARKDIGRISSRDLFMFGLGLYLGEGSKTHGFVRIVNANPGVIKAAVSWFKSLGVHKGQFAVSLHLYPDTDIKDSEKFWSRTIGIPVAQFRSVYIDTRTNKKKNKQGRLPYGTCHLCVQSRGKKEFGVVFSRKIQAWNDSVLERIENADVV